MSRPDACRIVVEPAPQAGAWNMAVDEVLLESAIERGLCTLRWYRWSSPTVSLGYFQNADGGDRRLAPLPRVRRLSGGGAILHHHEWTYSIALPASHPLAHEPGRLYDRAHEQIVCVLSRRGIPAALRGTASDGNAAPFLCFGRGDARDIVLHGHKIVGSAQRRRGGAILQHGSVLLRHSEHAPEFPGIRDLAPLVSMDDDVLGELTAALERAVGGSGRHDDLSIDERTRSAELADGRYSRLDWSRGGARQAPRI